MALVPPAERDGFSFAGDFYREASNFNRHRRATIPELQAHFKGKDATDNNRPAHWYEAQLLHYGLPPSKVKGTAHKRLFDAVNKGGLTVPAHILKIETDLKKEWMKRERETKQMVKSSAAITAPAKGTKRKADQASNSTNVNVNVSVQVSSSGKVTVQTAQPASKKAKTAPATKDKKTSLPKPSAVTTKPTSKKATAPPIVRKTATPEATKTTPKAPKIPKPSAKPHATPKPKSSSASSLGAAPSAVMRRSKFHDDEAPPPYSEFASGPTASSSTGKQKQQQSSSPSSSQPKIGLLNGRYHVSCKYIDAYHPEYTQDMGLIATLDGSNLWLKFDFGIATGLIKLSRPQEADPEYPSWAFWRGEAALDDNTNWQMYHIDTVHRVGQSNHVYFMGGGHIRGRLRYGPPDAAVELDFDAHRLAGQSMTSEISPLQARAEWARLDEYADQ